MLLHIQRLQSAPRLCVEQIQSIAYINYLDWVIGIAACQYMDD